MASVFISVVETSAPVAALTVTDIVANNKQKIVNIDMILFIFDPSFLIGTVDFFKVQLLRSNL